jgi:hypothetical protein
MYSNRILGLIAVTVISIGYAGSARSTKLDRDLDVSANRTKGGGSSGGTSGGSSGSKSNQTVSGVTNLYVSPTGNDAWSGKLQTPNSARTDGPKATLVGARDALRVLRQNGQVGAKGAVVNILPGSYRLTSSLALTSSDSGTTAAPITYRGTMPGSVEISGGVDVQTWGPVSDGAVASRFQADARSHIVEANLASLGVTDFGTRVRVGFNGAGSPSLVELFFEGEPMQVAQWPNSGWARTTSAPESSGWAFGYEGTRPNGWSSDNDVWVHGFFYWDWADFYERVAEMDKASGLVRTETVPSYGFRAGSRFVFVNVLEELDAPGEYYMDAARGRVYFYPPASSGDGRTVVSTLAGPLVQLDGASHVRFEGLSLRFSRGDGFLMSGCDDVAVSGCTISGMGIHGIEAVNATRAFVKSTDISEIGRSGIVMQGGDRSTLTSGGNVVENCHIATTGRILATSESAIFLTGVGTRVRNCSIHDLPNIAIRMRGNNHQIEANEIYRTCLDTSDAGAIYMGRDFSEQGVVIRGNYFHDIVQTIERNPVPGNSGTYEIKGVYLDDFASGATVYGNIFKNVDVGVQIGGGRDNSVRNNAFIDCSHGLYVDARGLDWASDSVSNPDSDLMTRLRNSSYQSTAYRRAYPNLASILTDDPAVPKRNVLQSNVLYMGAWVLSDGLYSELQNTSKSNVLSGDPGFSNLARLILTPRVKSLAALAGFKPLDARATGLKVDSFRRALPAPGAVPAM